MTSEGGEVNALAKLTHLWHALLWRGVLLHNMQLCSQSPATFCVGHMRRTVTASTPKKPCTNRAPVHGPGQVLNQKLIFTCGAPVWGPQDCATSIARAHLWLCYTPAHRHPPSGGSKMLSRPAPLHWLQSCWPCGLNQPAQLLCERPVQPRPQGHLVHTVDITYRDKKTKIQMNCHSSGIPKRHCLCGAEQQHQ